MQYKQQYNIVGAYQSHRCNSIKCFMWCYLHHYRSPVRPRIHHAASTRDRIMSRHALKAHFKI